jgi:hypothetical protein
MAEYVSHTEPGTTRAKATLPVSCRATLSPATPAQEKQKTAKATLSRSGRR